jgi:hypothetical protein
MLTEEDLTTIRQIEKGMKAFRFVLALPLINKQMQDFHFTVYSPRDGAEQRTAESANQSAADMVREFLHHDPHKNEEWVVPADLTSHSLDVKISGLPGYRALAINSRCKLLDGTQVHIPMMDFKPSPSVESLDLIRESLKKMSQNGVILESADSGESGHPFR